MYTWTKTGLPLLFDKVVRVFLVVFFKLHVKNVFCFLSRGFCYFNSIAIAAKQLREKYKLNKILVVDWVSYMTLFPQLAAEKKKKKKAQLQHNKMTCYNK